MHQRPDVFANAHYVWCPTLEGCATSLAFSGGVALPRMQAKFEVQKPKCPNLTQIIVPSLRIPLSAICLATIASVLFAQHYVEYMDPALFSHRVAARKGRRKGRWQGILISDVGRF